MTTTAYDPDLIDRLVREAREDDATIRWADQHFRESAPWPECGHDEATCPCFDNNDRVRSALAKATLRVRDNIAAMADQLEAARREVERWKTLAEYHCGAQNREVEPCEDGSCSHSYDSWPVGSVTKHAREVDQCDDCGWTAVQVDAYRAAKGKT